MVEITIENVKGIKLRSIEGALGEVKKDPLIITPRSGMPYYAVLVEWSWPNDSYSYESQYPLSLFLIIAKEWIINV